jgi:FtsP/CotA-like multicopper oxidase with cupredoxin domain
MESSDLTRRDVLKISAFGAAAIALPFGISVGAARASELAENLMPRPYARQDRFVRPPIAVPTGVDRPPGGPERDVFTITMRPFGAQLVRGFTTGMWGYDGIFPGPTFRATRGRGFRVRFINDLPVRHPVFGYEPATSVHLHGGGSLPQYDGYANDITRPGQFKDYLYDNAEESRTAWYHDHVVHFTAENVAMGLAGQYHITDPDDAEFRLPRGEYELPLIVNDVAFTARGQLLFDDRGHSGPMGDVIMVNGVPWPAMPVEPRKYRFRMLDASIARGYRFTLAPSAPITVIGTDAGLTRAPIPTNVLRMGMGERYDVVIDFAPFRGRRVELRNLGVENTIDYDNTNKVMAFDVLDQDPNPDNNGPLPATLRPDNPVLSLRPTATTRTRTMRFDRQGGEWTINNGETWEDVVRSGFRRVIADPALGAVEVWEFVNNSGGWFHPIHLHQTDWLVLSRNGRPPAAYENAGPKDVVYLGENDRIRVIQRFGPHEGRYMFHCHNNSHEDHDMMSQFRIGRDINDPIRSAPAQGTPKAP